MNEAMQRVQTAGVQQWRLFRLGALPQDNVAIEMRHVGVKRVLAGGSLARWLGSFNSTFPRPGSLISKLRILTASQGEAEGCCVNTACKALAIHLNELRFIKEARGS